MAPEVLGNRHSTPTTASDVFQVGLVIFFVVTGSRPFHSLNQRALTAIGKARYDVENPLMWPADDEIVLPMVSKYKAVVDIATRRNPESRPSIVEIHEKLASVTDVSSSAKLKPHIANSDLWGLVGSARLKQARRKTEGVAMHNWVKQPKIGRETSPESSRWPRQRA